MSAVANDARATTTDKVCVAVVAAIQVYRERLDGDPFATGLDIHVRIVGPHDDPRRGLDVGDVSAVAVKQESILKTAQLR